MNHQSASSKGKNMYIGITIGIAYGENVFIVSILYIIQYDKTNPYNNRFFKLVNHYLYYQKSYNVLFFAYNRYIFFHINLLIL